MSDILIILGIVGIWFTGVLCGFLLQLSLLKKHKEKLQVKLKLPTQIEVIE